MSQSINRLDSWTYICLYSEKTTATIFKTQKYTGFHWVTSSLLLDMYIDMLNMEHRRHRFTDKSHKCQALSYIILYSSQIVYAAVDCTKGQNHELCKQEGVEGYPTFSHYNYGKFVDKYNGDRGVSYLSCSHVYFHSHYRCHSLCKPTQLSKNFNFFSLFWMKFIDH